MIWVVYDNQKMVLPHFDSVGEFREVARKELALVLKQKYIKQKHILALFSR